MNQWYRLAMMPRGWVIVFALLVAFCDLFGLGIWLSFRSITDDEMLQRSYSICISLSVMLCAVAAGAIGSLRAVRCPLTQASYREWLFSTPWRSPDQTPFGPCVPVWQDVIPLGLLGMLSVAHFHLASLTYFPLRAMALNTSAALATHLLAFALPTVAFLGTWIFFTLLHVIRCVPAVGYTCLFWAALLIHLVRWTSPEVAIIGLLSSFVLAVALYRHVVMQLLTAIPEWSVAMHSEPDRTKQLSIEQQFLAANGYRLPGSSVLEHLRKWAAAISLILFVGLTAIDWWHPTPMIAVLFIFMSFLVMTAHMTGRCNSHLGLLARLKLRRLVIPEYDRILIRPFLSLVVGTLIIGIGYLHLLPHGLTAPLAVAVSVYILLQASGEFPTWSLTAPIHFFATQRSSTKTTER